MSDREQRLRALLGQVSRKDLAQVGMDDDLVRELGLDSLAALRLLAAVEKHFDVRFPDDRLGDFRTLRKIDDFLAAPSRAAGR